MSFDLSKLNDKQKEAALHKDGPLLILAGAGSGKTHTMTERMGVLMENYGVRPGRILAITFTNKAAEEMKERAKKKYGKAGEEMTISTFHSLCAKILRKEIRRIKPYDSNFSIFDSDDSKAIVKDALKELEIDPEDTSPKMFQTFISSFKNELLRPEDVAKLISWNLNPTIFHDIKKEFPPYLNLNQALGTVVKIPVMFQKQVLDVYRLYQERLQESNAVDFDDLMMLGVRLFMENPEVLGRYQDTFWYIMVDEYQDTNHAQYVFSRLLAAKSRNIAVVGDDYQCIYGFRNANLQNILNFEKDYPEAKVVMLEQNFRSTQSILDLANKVIAFNKNQKHKKLWTSKTAGMPVQYRVADNTLMEARTVVEEIQKLTKIGTYRNQDFAVLYRVNAQSRAFEEELIKAAIPYKIVGGVNFYQRKEIKDMIAYLRFIFNNSDNLSLKRIINAPKRGIGDTTIEKIVQFAGYLDISLWDALQRANEYLPSAAVKKLDKLIVLFRNLIELSKNYRIGELVMVVLDDSGYKDYLEERALKKGDVDAEDRLGNLQEFLNIAWEYQQDNVDADLEGFLERIALVVEESESGDEKDENRVILQTIHGSKGLEYPVVFLVGLEENMLPYFRAMEADDDIEEERRLCYVGITRAKEVLYVLRAEERRLYNNLAYNDPSRFLIEMGFEKKEKTFERFKLPTW